MDKEFVPYQESLELKELGFDEPCFGYYNGNNEFTFFVDVRSCNTNSEFGFYPTSPTFSQAFRWFREKYGLYDIISKNSYMIEGELNNEFLRITILPLKSHEEAELACLRKLIEIVKNKL